MVASTNISLHTEQGLELRKISVDHSALGSAIRPKMWAFTSEQSSGICRCLLWADLQLSWLNSYCCGDGDTFLPLGWQQGRMSTHTAVKPRNTCEGGVVPFLLPGHLKDTGSCVYLLLMLPQGKIFWATVWFFFFILASLCFFLYLVLLKPEQIFKIVNEETDHGEVDVPSSETSELSEPEVFCSCLYT